MGVPPMKHWASVCSQNLECGDKSRAARGSRHRFPSALCSETLSRHSRLVCPMSLTDCLFEVAFQATMPFAPEPRAALRLPWAKVKPPLRGFGITFPALRPRMTYPRNTGTDIPVRDTGWKTRAPFGVAPKRDGSWGHSPSSFRAFA